MNDHKKIDRHRWHMRKSWIRTNCAIIMAILLIVLLWNFPIVHAESNSFKLKDYFYTSDFLHTSGVQDAGMLANHGHWNDTWKINTFVLTDSEYDNLKDTLGGIFDLDIPYNYNGVQDASSLSNLELLIFLSKNYSTDNTIYVAFGENSGSYPKASDVYGSIDGNNGTDNSTGSFNTTYAYAVTNNNVSVANNWSSKVGKFCLCTRPIICDQNGINFNYLQINQQCGKGEGGYTGGDTSVQDHQLAYEGSCVYMTSSNFNNGSLHIVYKGDSYQRDNNFFVKLRVSNTSSVVGNSNYLYNNSGDLGLFENNFSVPDNTFNLGTYSDYDIPLSNFGVSGDYSIDLADINKGIIDSNERSLYSFNSCFEDISTGVLKNIVDGTFTLLSALNLKWDSTNQYNYKYDLSSNTYNVSVALCGGTGSDYFENIFDSFSYDMVSGSVTHQDYPKSSEEDVKEKLNTTIIPSNYIPSPQKPSYPNANNVTVPYNPSNNNDNNDTNNNNVAPTNNNNVTNGDYSPSVVNNNNVTIDQGNRYPEKGVMTSFIRIINNDKNNAVNDVNTLVAGNDFIRLCNNVLYAVPNQYWNVWLIAIKAILGIGVSAFFLKILFNWAT